MKRFWSIVSVTFLGLVASIGINTSSAFASQQQFKVDEVKETTPLYLIHGSDLLADDGSTSWHYSHSSHGSHGSHGSHSSHVSHYSSR